MMLHWQLGNINSGCQVGKELELPHDLVNRGFKLVIRGPSQMFAVSNSRGCTGTKSTIEAVIKEARAIAGFIEWAERQKP